MFRLLARLVPSAIAILVLVGVSSASAVIPLKERCAGTITNVTPGNLSFAGQGRATFFGNYSVVGSNDFDALGNVLNGQFTTTTATRDTISGVFSGTYTPLPSGQIRFEVTLTWLSGTGRLAGVTGQANVVALLDGLAPGAAFRYEGLGSLALP